MPDKRKAELIQENEELRSKLESVHAELGDFLEIDGDEEEEDDEDGEDGEEE